jgi:hypothetical protein
MQVGLLLAEVTNQYRFPAAWVNVRPPIVARTLDMPKIDPGTRASSRALPAHPSLSGTTDQVRADQPPVTA